MGPKTMKYSYYPREVGGAGRIGSEMSKRQLCCVLGALGEQQSVTSLWTEVPSVVQCACLALPASVSLSRQRALESPQLVVAGRRACGSPFLLFIFLLTTKKECLN